VLPAFANTSTLGVIHQTMKIKSTFTLAIVLSSLTVCYGQKLNNKYQGIPSDSLNNGHQLEFKNDMTVEISTFPKHMSENFKMTFQYKDSLGTLLIYHDNISSNDSVLLVRNGFPQFIHRLSLTQQNRALIDNSSSLIYVLSKDFQKSYYITFIIDKKVYRQRIGQTDAYGLVKDMPEQNKSLQDKLSSIKSESDSFTLTSYRGLKAYNKFGYRSVFGVFELTRQN
jgi:hypothetical protein